MTYTNIIPNHSLKNIHQHTYLVVTITFTKSFDFQSSLYYQQTMTIFISQQLKITFCSFRVYLCIYLYMYVCKYVSVWVWVYGWFVGGWFVGCWWGRRGGACSKCILRHREGMISQRCSSPQHLAVMPRCWSSRGIQACCASSSQVMMVSYLSKSNKDVYCIEILDKYDHGSHHYEETCRLLTRHLKQEWQLCVYMYVLMLWISNPVNLYLQFIMIRILAHTTMCGTYLYYQAQEYLFYL